MTSFLLDSLAFAAFIGLILFMVKGLDWFVFGPVEREYYKKHGKKLSTDLS